MPTQKNDKNYCAYTVFEKGKVITIYKFNSNTHFYNLFSYLFLNLFQFIIHLGGWKKKVSLQGKKQTVSLTLMKTHQYGWTALVAQWRCWECPVTYCGPVIIWNNTHSRNKQIHIGGERPIFLFALCKSFLKEMS